MSTLVLLRGPRCLFLLASCLLFSFVATARAHVWLGLMRKRSNKWGDDMVGAGLCSFGARLAAAFVRLVKAEYTAQEKENREEGKTQAS